MAEKSFIDALRSTFMEKQAQVKAEKAAEKAAAKVKQAERDARIAHDQAKKGAALIEAQNRVDNFLVKLRDAVESAAKEATQKSIKTAEEKVHEAYKAPVESDTDSEVITYTYKPGDTFGQVITDLGLKTDAGLWGDDGDVAYYTKQIVDQGALDSRGNIPVGTTIRLRRRK